jgi:hypothetical protein
MVVNMFVYSLLPFRTCWFTEARLQSEEAGGSVTEAGSPSHTHHPATTLLALEATIQERREAMSSAAPGRRDFSVHMNVRMRCDVITF